MSHWLKSHNPKLKSPSSSAFIKLFATYFKKSRYSLTMKSFSKYPKKLLLTNTMLFRNKSKNISHKSIKNLMTLTKILVYLKISSPIHLWALFNIMNKYQNKKIIHFRKKMMNTMKNSTGKIINLKKLSLSYLKENLLDTLLPSLIKLDSKNPN